MIFTMIKEISKRLQNKAINYKIQKIKKNEKKVIFLMLNL